MKTAMILAAGKGERMRPLTDNQPKPLLLAGGKPLLQYHLENLARAGVGQIIINYARLGEMIEQQFGDGRAFGVDIIYSPEGDEPLETGGGIKKALPLLGAEAFIVVNADIWTDFDFRQLPQTPPGMAHLVLVPNPDHHPRGDFGLVNGQVTVAGGARYTFSGIGVYRPALFADCEAAVFPLAPVLRSAIRRAAVSGELYSGRWLDIGTPARLSSLNSILGGNR